MRQIERDTIRAVRDMLNGKRDKPMWRKGNMRVIRAVDMSTRKNVVTVCLHGNPIARVNEDTGELRVSLAGWDTVTTRSRLNTLARELVKGSSVRFWRKKGIAYTFVDDEIITADLEEWYTVGYISTL